MAKKEVKIDFKDVLYNLKKNGSKISENQILKAANSNTTSLYRRVKNCPLEVELMYRWLKSSGISFDDAMATIKKPSGSLVYIQVFCKMTGAGFFDVVKLK